MNTTSTYRKPIPESNILIAGTARDVAHCITSEINHLIACTSVFKSTKVFIVESDSSDQTVDCLSQLSNEISFFSFISLGKLSATIPSRTQRLSHCRNQIVNGVRDDPQFQSIDFVLLADLDGVNTLLTKEKIAQCWTLQENWDVICANQLNYYYDIWALRHPYWSPNNYLEQYQHLTSFLGPHQANQISKIVKQAKLDPSQSPIEVDSAFGGLAIYKRTAYISGSYGFEPGDVDEVDHAPFHRILREKGYRIFINPALINCREPSLPPSVKVKRRFVLEALRWAGNTLLGKHRFHKYLDFLKQN
jgi:hypothetical protein